jgi:hypothetical protein
MVEPCSIGIALETVYGASVGNLDCADLVDRNRKQQTRIAHGAAASSWRRRAIAHLYRRNGSNEQQQHGPYRDQPWTHAALNAVSTTTIPTSAISRYNTIDRKKSLHLPIGG